MNQPILINHKEAARLLGISLVTLWRWKARGLVKTVRGGMFRRDQIEAFGK